MFNESLWLHMIHVPCSTSIPQSVIYCVFHVTWHLPHLAFVSIAKCNCYSSVNSPWIDLKFLLYIYKYGILVLDMWGNCIWVKLKFDFLTYLGTFVSQKAVVVAKAYKITWNLTCTSYRLITRCMEDMRAFASKYILW